MPDTTTDNKKNCIIQVSNLNFQKYINNVEAGPILILNFLLSLLDSSYNFRDGIQVKSIDLLDVKDISLYQNITGK